MNIRKRWGESGRIPWTICYIWTMSTHISALPMMKWPLLPWMGKRAALLRQREYRAIMRWEEKKMGLISSKMWKERNMSLTAIYVWKRLWKGDWLLTVSARTKRDRLPISREGMEKQSFFAMKMGMLPMQRMGQEIRRLSVMKAICLSPLRIPAVEVWDLLMTTKAICWRSRIFQARTI